MAIYFVKSRNDQYQKEHDEEYLETGFMPEENGMIKESAKTMEKVRAGDFFIHTVKSPSRRIVALSIAVSDCYEGYEDDSLIQRHIQHFEKHDAEYGCPRCYYVDVAFFDLTTHILWNGKVREWIAAHPKENSAFVTKEDSDRKGTPTVPYLSPIAPEHARFLMEQILDEPQPEEVRELAREIYEQTDAPLIHGDELLQKARKASAREKRPPRKSVRMDFPRDPYIAQEAKERANGHCQLCGEAAPFHKENGEPYLECHHVVWLSQGGDDDLTNVVALCPNCHRKMHELDDPDDVSKLKALAQSLPH